MGRWLFIGGGGTISGHASRAALEAGHHVTIFSRTRSADLPVVADHIAGNRDDPAALEKAIDAVRPDVLVDFVCFQPDQAAALVAAARGKARHVVFVSTCDVLGYPLQQVPAPDARPCTIGLGQYVLDKQACEAVFRKAEASSAFALTIVRPGYSLGPGFVISLFEPQATETINRMRHGLPVILPGDGTTKLHVSDANDTGRMVATVGGAPVAFGRAYVIGTPDSILTHAQYMRLIALAAGARPAFVEVPALYLRATGFAQMHIGLFARLTQFDIGFAMDAFQRDFPAFRWQGRILDGLLGYVARAEASGALATPPQPGFEDEIIEGWRSARAGAARMGAG